MSLCVSLSGVRDYCETETFNASCRPGEVIVIKSAHYGRMRLGRCVKKDLGYIGCSTGERDAASLRCVATGRDVTLKSVHARIYA